MRYFLPHGAVIFLMALMLTATGREPIDADTQLRFADGLMVRGLHEHAIREYQIFREGNPGYEQMDVIDYRIGECYRHLNNLAAAVRAYTRVIDRDPPSVYRHRAMLRRAEMFRLADRKETAITLLRELLDEAQDPAIRDAAHFWIGSSLAAMGERDAAAGTWRDFLNQDRVSAFTPYVALELGKLLAAGNAAEREEAGQWLQRVADEPPDSRHGAEALYQLARLAERSGDDAGAAELFDGFWGNYADDLRAAEARLPTAWTYYRIGRYADSLRICTETLESADTDAADGMPLDQWYYLKANNERRLGKHASAAETYTRLLEKAPRSDLAQAAVLEKAQSQYKIGDRQRSLETMANVRITDAIRLPALWLLATAHDDLDNDSEAIQNYRLIIEHFPESDQAYEATYRLGLLFQNRGAALQTAEYFQAVADKYPDRSMAPTALLAAAEQWRSVDRHSEAVRGYAQLLERYPDHDLVVEALYRKGSSEGQLERNELAIRSFNELVERFPDNPYMADAAFSLGLLYSRDGNHADAETAFERALKAGPDNRLRSRIIFRRALALQRLNRDREAAELFEALLDDPHMDRFDPPLLEWLSKQLREGQRPREAINAADILIETAGDTPEWRQIGHALAGLAALDADDKELARSRFESALAANVHTPLAADAAVNLGELLLDQARVADARHWFREGEKHAQQSDATVLRARALMGLAACYEADDDLTDANRYYSLVGLTYNIPGLTEQALRKAADTFERLGRDADRDKILLELEQRYDE